MSRQLRIASVGFLVTFAVANLGWAQDETPTETAESSPEALAAYADAAGYQNNKAFDLAAEEWQKFLEKHPSDPKATEARYNLAVCHLQAQKFAEAVDELKKVVASDQQFDRTEDAHLNLGWAQYSLALQDHPESFADAAESFRVLLDKFPDGKYRDQGLFFRGESLYMQGKREEALVPYRELAQKHADSDLRADGLYALGVAYEDQRKHAEAGEIYDTFLKEFPQHDLATEVRMRKAETVLQAGEFAEAEKLFAAVANTEGFRNIDHALYRQAFCVSRQDRYKESADLFAKVVEDIPQSAYAPDAAIAAGRAYYRAEEFDLADTWFKKVAENDARHAPEAVHWRARILIDRDQPDKARELIAAILPQAQEHPFLVNLKLDDADALYKIADRREESIAAYLKIADDYPDHQLAPKALYNAAYGAMELADYQNGLKNAERFFGQYGDHPLQPEVKKVAAECQLQLGKHDDAAEAYAELANLGDGGEDASKFQLRRGLTLYLQKKYGEALNILQSVLASSKSADEKAEAHYWIGMSLVGLGKLPDAVSSFEASLSAQPNWRQADEVLLNLSRAMRRVDRLADAKSTVTKLIANHPQSRVLDQAFFRLAEFCYASNDYAEAIENYSKVIDNWADSKLIPFSLYGRGWSQLRSGHPDAALTDFDRLLAQHADHDLARQSYYARGMAHHQSGQHAEALKDVEAFLNTESDDTSSVADALYLRGLAYVGLKDNAAAVDVFKSLLNEHPQYAGTDKVLYELAWALRNAGDDTGALAAFERLTSTKPESPLAAEAFYHVGEDRYAKKDYKSADEAYVAASKGASSKDLREKVIYKLGWSHYQQADYDQALESFQQQLQIDSQSNLAADALFMRGECLFKSQRYEQALDAFMQARANPSKNETMKVLTYLHAGQAAAQLKQWQTSLQWTSLLAREFPNSPYLPQALYEQGWARRNLGQLDQAIELLAEVTEKSRGELGARARFMLGETYFEKKDFNAAIREFRKVMFGYGAEKAPEPIKKWQAKSAFEAGRCASVLAGQAGDAQRRAQFIDGAKKFFQYVAEKHPESGEAPAAAEQLKRLGA